jgi:hypothetical protein
MSVNENAFRNQAIALKIPADRVLSEMAMLRQLVSQAVDACIIEKKINHPEVSNTVPHKVRECPRMNAMNPTTTLPNANSIT